MMITFQWGIWAGAGAATVSIFFYFYLKRRKSLTAKQPLKTSREIPKFVLPPPTDPTRQGLKNSINTTRNQPINKLPVAVDFPRLARKTMVFFDDNILLDGSKCGFDDSSVFEEQSRVKILKQIWESVSQQLNEDYSAVENHLLDYMGTGDISIALANFFKDHYSEDTKSLRIFKVCNQSILAAAVIRMKEVSIEWPYKDQRGQWNILINFGTDRISVSHVKQEISYESASQYDSRHFEFTWELRMEFDLEVRELLDACIYLKSFEFVPTVPHDTRQKIISQFNSCQCIELYDELKEYL